jgi:hypothetical protein
MITRKEFLSKCAAASTTGLFCCMGHAQAQANQPPTCDPEELTQVKGTADAARNRFAALIREMDSSLPESQRKQLLHGLGEWCANEYRANLIDRFKGDIHGFIEEARRSWMTEAQYDEAKGVIHIVGKWPTCVCPLVKDRGTPGSFCECTLGWQETVYSAILGRPVKGEIKESILRGDKQCVFEVKVV